MNKELLKGLVEQINMEMQSAYIYLGMSSYLNEADFPGFSSWMMEQAKEEMAHAMRIYAYLQERGEHVELFGLDPVSVNYDGVLEAFEASLAHEKLVSASINKLMNMAHDARDFSAMGMLQWFVDEQVEEEANFNAALAKLRMAGGKGSSLLMLDHKFAKREEE